LNMRAVFNFMAMAGLLTAAARLAAQVPKPPLVPVPSVPMPPVPSVPMPPEPVKPSLPSPGKPQPGPSPPVVQPAPGPVFPATDLAPEHRPFIKPKVPVPLFTPAKTALLEVECERIAIFLAREAAEKYSPAVLRGEREAMSEGRLMLTISLHLMPLNASAVHCSDCWAEGKAPSLPPPGEDMRAFSSFLLMAAQRQAGGKAGSAREVLGRVLMRLAADYDPKNEDAVYASEMQDRGGKAPPLRELLEGTVTVK